MNDEKIIPDLTWDFMFGRVRDYIWREFDVDPPTAATLLIEFANQHGDEAVVSMYGFLRYVATHKGDDRNKDEGMIKATIGHDLNGRNDKHMLPRTNSYYKFCND